MSRFVTHLWHYRAYFADTVALISFFTTTGIINERFIAGMAWEEVFHARVLGALLMLPVGRPYGIWRNWLMDFASDAKVSRVLWDSLSLVSFQVPIYIGIIALSGASGWGLVNGAIGASAMMLFLGRPYGAYLNFVRRIFNLPSGGIKPMSLG